MATEPENDVSKALFEAYASAPEFVQAFVSGGEFGAFSAALEQKLGLDADTGARVANELLMTLLGITMPTDLEENLRTAARVPENLISSIIEEAGAGIFEPLVARGNLEGNTPASSANLPEIAPSHELMTRPQTPAAPPASRQVSVPAPVSPARPVPTPAYSAPAPVSRPVPPAPAYRAPATPVPAAQPTSMPAPAQGAVAATPTPSVYETFHARTMAADIQSMQGGGGPIPTPRPVTAPVTTTRPVPTPTPRPESTPVAQPTAPARPIPSAEQVHEDLKKYGIDPYREPIE